MVMQQSSPLRTGTVTYTVSVQGYTLQWFRNKLCMIHKVPTTDENHMQPHYQVNSETARCLDHAYLNCVISILAPKQLIVMQVGLSTGHIQFTKMIANYHSQ